MIRIDDLKGLKTVRRWMAEAHRADVADVVRSRFGEDAASAGLPLPKGNPQERQKWTDRLLFQKVGD
jgi:hypothetical protein